MDEIYKSILLEDLDLSVRMESRLEFAKVKNFYDLLNTDLDKVRNMTKRGKREILEKIEEIKSKYEGHE